MSKLSLCNVYFIRTIFAPTDDSYIVVHLTGLWDGGEDDVVSLNVHDKAARERLRAWFDHRRMVCVEVTDSGDIEITECSVHTIG